MFLDAREIPSGAVIEADLCIIGAGAAGITIAREFAGGPVTVCLLESGGLAFRWDAQDLYRGANAGLPYFDLDVCQIRYFGGNTNAWGGWCRPLDSIDLEPRPWIEGGAWPLRPAELAPFYESAQEVCQLPAPGEFEAARWSSRLGGGRAALLPVDPDRLVPQVYQFSPPTRFGHVYREAIARAPNIRCLLNGNALCVAATADARRATHVEVGTLAGGRFRIAARHFVLAAGGIENARLLLLSRDVAPAGLGNGNDLVGRHFMEHPHSQRVVLPARRPLPVSLYGLHYHGRGVSVRLALPPALQRREQLLHYSANLHPVYAGHQSAGWLAFRKLVLSLLPSRATDPYVRFPPYGRKGLSFRQVGDILRQFDKVTAAAFLQLLKPERFVVGYVLESKSEQAPNPESRVLLDRERDAFGLNRVRLDWRMLPIDRRTVLRGEAIVDEELRRLGLGMLAPLPAEAGEAWPESLEGGWHQLGTTRMAEDPRRGVVDRDGRIHGMANLFVAGGSVFPTGGTAPPTLTVVALALRLAAHLKERLAGTRPAEVGVPRSAAAEREPATLPLAATPAGAG